MCPGSILYYIMWELFKTFFHIGLFTFGGGYAMIPLIEAKVVDEKKWIDREMLLDLIAIAQSCPGIFAVNISIFIGYRIKGTSGAVVGALATSLPSFIIILAIALFFQQFRENEYVDRFFRGLRPAVVALIAAPVFRMGVRAKITMSTIWIPMVSAVAIWTFGVSPIYVILIAGLAGYAYGQFIKE